MIDTLKREINYLRISVTDRCNLRCVYCMPKEGVSFLGHNDILRYEEMLRVVRIAVQQGITKIRVTGVVPTQGHWGSTAGKRKTVAIWAHKGTAGVPTKWNPKSRGWVLVGTVKCHGMGVYKTPYFKPLKTLTLVAQYGGDDWYWGAYTSVKRIKVR
jgi:hypothetical protein